MKKTKSILAIAFALIFMSLSVLPSFAVLANSTETPYEHLLKCGYTEEFLNSISEEMLLKIYEATADNVVANVEESVIYLDEEGVPYLSNPLGTIDSNSLKIEIKIYELFKKDTNQLGGLLYTAEWEWGKNKPQVRHKDAITVNWDNNVFGQEIFWAQDTARNSLSEEKIVLQGYDAPQNANQGGIGHSNDISFTYNYNYVGGGMIICLDPSQPMFKSPNANKNIYNTKIYFNFVHNRNPLGLGVSITPGGFGFTIDSGALSDSISKSKGYSFSKTKS